MLLNQFWKYIDFEINQKKCLTRKITIRTEEENLMFSNKNAASSKVLIQNSGSDFNHLVG
jgi:hypothetical protein